MADIAQSHLTAAAASQVAQLLALEGYTRLDEVSSWPDEIRRDQPQTGPWHYVDIPLYAPAYDATRDCPQGNCVVAKLVEFEETLADPKASPEDRLRALKWIVHLVGDVHQPLHAEDHDDKGGNEIRLTYFGKRTNLHAVWDGGIIEHALDLHLGPEYSFDHVAVEERAKWIDRDVPGWQAGALITNSTRARVLDAGAVGWANQSHRLARIAYAYLPEQRSGDWAEDYQKQAWPIVERQLVVAGRSLAEVLNKATKSVFSYPDIPLGH